MRNNFKRIISIISALGVFFTSLVTSGIFTYADNTVDLSKSLISGVIPNSWIVHDDNLQYAEDAATKYPNNEIVNKAKFEFFTDGDRYSRDLSTMKFTKDGKEYFIGSYRNSDGTLRNTNGSLEVYHDIIFPLDEKTGTPAEIEKFFICGNREIDGDKTGRTLGKLEVYFSRELNTLTSKENLAINYENTEKKENIEVSLNEPVVANYMLVRITMGINGATGWEEQAVPNVGEIAVFGNANPDMGYKVENNKNDVTLNDSLIKDKAVTFTQHDFQNDTLYTYPDWLVTGFKGWTDGQTASGPYVDVPRFNENGNTLNLKSNYDATLDAVVSLTEKTGKQSVINGIYVANAEMEWRYYAYKYSIYVSNSLEKLDSEESLIATYCNVDRAATQYFSFEKPITGAYLMLRVTMAVPVSFHGINDGEFPITDWGCGVHISELAVFGNETDSYELTNDLPDLTKSVIYGTAGGINSNHKAIQVTSHGSKKSEVKMNFNAFKVVTDGKTDGQVDWGYSSGDSETDNGENGRLNRYHKWASYYFMHNNSSKLETYEDFVFDFSKNGTTVDISRFFIGTLPSDSAIYKFEIYAAETMEDIYNSENLVATCSNINKSDKINITLNKLKPANYCVLRVIFPKEYKSGVTDWMRTHLTEFGIFGNRNVEVINNQTPDKSLSGSLIYGVTPSVMYICDKGEKYDLLPNPNRGNLTDGKLDTVLEMSWEGAIGKFKNPDGAVRNQSETEVYNDIIWQLGFKGKPAIIDEVYLNFTEEASLTANHFQIFASDNLEDIGKEDTLVADVINEQSAQSQIVRFNKKVKATYIMVRILMGIQPYTTWHYEVTYARINEIAVFGESTSKVKTQLFSPDTDFEYFKRYGESIIQNKKPVSIKYSGVSVEEDFTTLTDGDFSWGKDYKRFLTEYPNTKGDYLDVIYRIADEPYEIDSIISVTWRDAVSPGYWTGRYQVYVSVDREDLFLPENCVYEYDHRVQGQSWAQRGYWETDKPVGCYIAIRYIESMTKLEDWIWLRAEEFAVYGKKADIKTTPINLADNMPVEGYTVASDGKMTQMDNTILTSKKISSMTDGEISTTAEFNVGNKRTEFVYNLCQNARVYGFSLKSKANIGFKNGVKIYASNDLHTLWDESTLVYESDDINKTGTEFTNPLSVRYVRFSIPENSGKEISIAEVVINGMSDQLLKKRNILPYIDSASCSVLEYDYSSYNQNYLTVDRSELMLLFDEDKSLVPLIYGAESGKSSLDYLINLEDLRNISKINISFDYNADAWLPVKGKIYIGETMEYVTGKNRKAIKEFNTIPDENGWEVEIVPTMARYICISFEKMSDSYTFDSYIAPAITEISLMATNVRGTNTSLDSDSLYSFTDSETGIKWEIVRNTLNDIFTDVYSSRLIKSKITSAANENISKSGYKPISGIVGEIAFYDRTGKRLTDIGGRTVRVYYPNTDGIDPMTTLIFTIDGAETNGENSYLSIDGKYMCADLTDLSKMNSLLTLYTGIENIDDKGNENIENPSDSNNNWDNNYNDGSNDNNSDSNATDSDNNNSVKQRRKKIIKKTIKRISDDNDNFNWLIVIIPAGIIMVAGATVIIVIGLKKKRGKEKANK